MTTRLEKTYSIDKGWPSLPPSPVARVLIVEWERAGLNAKGLYGHLLEAAQERQNYERRRQNLASRKRLGRREQRRFRAAIENGKPLIELIRKSAAGVPGQPGVLLAEIVEGWVDALMRDLEAESKRGLDQGRPGEPWLRKLGRPGEPWLREPVVHLAEQLRAKRTSWRRTIQMIERAFASIQMGDIISLERIRHAIRDHRRKNARFGTADVGRCEDCTPSSGIGEAVENIARAEQATGPERWRRLVQGREGKRILQALKAPMEQMARKVMQMNQVIAQRAVHEEKHTKCAFRPKLNTQIGPR